MKKLTILFLSLVAVATTITSCHKDNPTPATTLALTIKDNNNSLVNGAKVVLYSDNNYSVKVDSTVTASNGLATFNKNLKNQIYYFDITTDQSAGCLTNYYSVSATVDTNGNPTAIPANKTTSMDVQLFPTGELGITNNSGTDSYNFYFTIPGDSSNTFYKLGKFAPSDSFAYPVPTGTLSVKWIKLNTDGSEIQGSDIVKDNISITACNTIPVQPL